MAKGMTITHTFVSLNERKKFIHTEVKLTSIIYRPNIPKNLDISEYSLPPKNKLITKWGNIR